MINLLLTNDYEILGNGRGSPLDLMVEPTSDMAQYLAKWNIKQTIFVDMLEYINFKESRLEHSRGEKSYDTLIREQLQHLYLLGNDVQLHIHPQWLGARQIGRDSWIVDKRLWSIGSIGSETELFDLIKLCKDELESIISCVDRTYRCVAFRAGAYGIQPEVKVLRALYKNDIRIDSSVSLSRINKKTPNNFDFRRAPRDLPFWFVFNDVSTPANNGSIIELPVSTHKQTRFLYNHNNKKIKSRLKRAIMPSIVNIDFCKFTSYELIQGIKKRIREIQGKHSVIPIVLIGHSKDWKSPNIDQFLDWASSNENIQFETVHGWHQKFKSDRAK